MSRISTPTLSPGTQREGLISKPTQRPTVTGPKAISTLQHRIRILMDVSGSMEEPFSRRESGIKRLDAAKTAMIAMVSASDKASTAYALDTFSDYADELIPLTTNYDTLRLARLSSQSSTMIAHGIGHSLTSLPTRIILLSDGQPSDSTEEVLNMARLAARKGVPIDTVAIGAADDELLRQIAEITGGIFFRCETTAQLTETFLKLEPYARLLLTHKPT